MPDIRISRTDNDRASPTSLPISTGMSYDFDTKPSLSSITPKLERAFRVQTSILQPDISVIRVGTNDLTSRIDRYLPGEKMTNKQKETDENNIEQGWYGVIHPDDETFAECYEVTYRMDSQSQNEEEDQSSIPMKIDFDPLEYKNLTTRLPPMIHNEYEQINDDQIIDQNDRKFQRFEKRDHSLEHLETILKERDVLIDDITRNKSRSVDDLSRTSNDQTSSMK